MEVGAVVCWGTNGTAEAFEDKQNNLGTQGGVDSRLAFAN